MAKQSEAAPGSGVGTRPAQVTDIARAFPFDMATARRIGDLLPVAMYCCDAPSGRITFYNAQAAALWGREPDVGATDERFCGSFRLWRANGELLPHEQTPMAFALREGREFRNEDVVIERPDHSRIRVLVNIDPIRDAGGRVIGAVNVFHDVTALQEATDALRDSEQRFRTMIDALPAAIYTTDAQGRLTHFNPAAVKFSGRTPELGTDQWCVSWKLYHPDGTPLPHDQCPMAVALKEGRAVRGTEAVAERPDGTRVHFEPYPTPLRDAKGRIVGGINMLMDVTHSKRAQAALRDLLNQAPLGVYLVDAAFLIREANPIAQRTFGDIPGGVIGRNFDQVIRVLWDDSFAEEIVRIFRHTLVTGEPFVTAERAGVRRDLGITEYYEWRLDRLTLPDGAQGVVCYFREISGQVRARQAIAESERQFRQIADSMPQIVWTARPDGYIDYYNERWYEYTDCARGQYGQSSWAPILHPDDLQRCIDTYFGCIRTQQPYQIEYRLRDARSGGYRWFMGRALPIRDERGHVTRWFGTCTDIDDAKKVAESLRESNELLSRFNRLAVDRELRMIELKKEINGLCRQRGEAPRYLLKSEADRPSDPGIVTTS